MKTMETTPTKFMHILIRLSHSNTWIYTSSLRGHGLVWLPDVTGRERWFYL